MKLGTWNLRVLGWALVLINAAAAVAEPQSQKKAPSAQEMMIRAHRARAQWKDFPGFEADAVLVVENRRIRRKVTVTPELELKWDQPLPQAFAAAGRRLLSVVQHRRANEQREYDVTLVPEKGAHPLGRLIRFNDDAMHSQYRIRGDVITQVSRQTPGGGFTITVLQVVRNPEKKYLPRVYTVTFFNKPQQGPATIRSSNVVVLEWERVGRWDLPRRIRSVGSSPAGVKMEVIRLQNHRLLEENE